MYTRRTLIGRGFSDVQIKRAVREGRLTPVRRGWYARDRADPDAVTAVRKGGALTCVSALDKHGLWVPPGKTRLHIRLSRHHGPARASCRGYGGPCPVDQAVDDIPHALLCAARCVPEDYWVAIADSVLRRRAVSVEELRGCMPCVPPAVERMLRKCDGRSQSGTESIARVRLRGEGFKVVVQPEVASFHGHADLRIGRLLVECDSFEFHAADRDAYRYDRYRDRKSLVGRWFTMRLTYDDVVYGWGEVLNDIREFTRADRHRLRGDRRPR
ncbi:hypothetical protein [Gordonia crocea]|uniref:DUF559 domain-containing protein n=1 Tax=Gordonia crocea TaxID=589162 RepID=A0A7M4BQ47_9ACTN|nr:hypothetical protein [Gordonia crocea]GED96008.1 hypothetical protein nbrc107697_00470 [Gordonia crocea]